MGPEASAKAFKWAQKNAHAFSSLWLVQADKGLLSLLSAGWYMRASGQVEPAQVCSSFLPDSIHASNISCFQQPEENIIFERGIGRLLCKCGSPRLDTAILLL